MDCTLSSMSDWDAARYHRVSDPQRAWGRRVLDRLAPCRGRTDPRHRVRHRPADGGSHARVPAAGRDRGRPIGPGRWWPRRDGICRRRCPVVQADAAALPFAGVVRCGLQHGDVPLDPGPRGPVRRDPPRAPPRRAAGLAGRRRAESRAALRPDRRRRRESQTSPSSLRPAGRIPGRFAGVDETRDRLDAGRLRRRARLARVGADDFSGCGYAYAEFVTTVCLRHQLDRLPDAKRDAFVDRLTRAGSRRRSSIHARLLAAEHRCPKAAEARYAAREQRRTPSARRAAAAGPPCSPGCGWHRFCRRWPRLVWWLGFDGGMPAFVVAARAAACLRHRWSSCTPASRNAPSASKRCASSTCAAPRGWIATGTRCPRHRRRPASAVEGHPYAIDLDVFGRASLFQWIGPGGDRSTGTARWRAGCCTRASRRRSISRQAAVAELAPLDDWREQLAAFGVLGRDAPARLDRRVPALGRERRARHCAA